MTDDTPKRENQQADIELAKLLIEQKLVTHEEVDASLRDWAGGTSEAFEQTLVRRSVVTESQLARAKSYLEESKGQQIPGYQILTKLGAGAMATVFKARQISLDRMVAIKVLPRKLSENSDYVERFYKEGKAAASLNHANIVQAFDVGEAGGFHYFVMEYVEGHTLYDELQTNKVFGEAEALNVIRQIARALAHSHSQGLIHRDVKPKNIMISTDGIAKLADMGLAREATDIQAAQAEAGKAFGTPYYISPEQIRGEVDIDFRADIYSLGATLYHLVTGRVPFEAPTPAGVMHKHLKDPLIPPDHINTKLSGGLGQLVEVMMAKERSRRYRSTGDLLIDLDAVAAGEAPPQAHKQMDAGTLSMLQQGGASNRAVAAEAAAAAKKDRKLLTYIVILAGALFVSLVLHIIRFAHG